VQNLFIYIPVPYRTGSVNELPVLNNRTFMGDNQKIFRQDRGPHLRNTGSVSPNMLILNTFITMSLNPYKWALPKQEKNIHPSLLPL
jgi:hypothetical protein